MTRAVLRVARRTVPAQAKGREPAPAAVDQPKLTAGGWVRDGGVVVERPSPTRSTSPSATGSRLDGRSFTVAGIAVTAAIPPYPDLCYACGCTLQRPLPEQGSIAGQRSIGLIWLTEPDARALARPRHPR